MIEDKQVISKVTSDIAVLFERFFDVRPIDRDLLVPQGSEAALFVRFFEVEALESSVQVQATSSVSAFRGQKVEKLVGQEQSGDQALEQEQEQKQEQDDETVSFLARLKRGMRKTRSQLTQGLTHLFSRSSFDEAFFDELEAQLIMADIGVTTTADIISSLKTYAQTPEVYNQPDARLKLQSELKSLLLATLVLPAVVEDSSQAQSLEMILVVGVNGVGKTTTIGKLAYQAQAQGKSVMLAAGDTFRAAAVEQLQVWGERVGVPVVAQGQGADSASVLYDALHSAQAKKIDVLIADTAGRLHNKSNLMNELHKIVKVVKKVNPDAPHKVLLVVDGCTGQNALSQGKEFNAAVPLTGIVVTKLDGTAKGGILFALSQSLGVPIDYIGIGEQVEDLRQFDPQAYVDALLDFEEVAKE